MNEIGLANHFFALKVMHVAPVIVPPWWAVFCTIGDPTENRLLELDLNSRMTSFRKFLSECFCRIFLLISGS